MKMHIFEHKNLNYTYPTRISNMMMGKLLLIGSIIFYLAIETVYAVNTEMEVRNSPPSIGELISCLKRQFDPVELKNFTSKYKLSAHRVKLLYFSNFNQGFSFQCKYREENTISQLIVVISEPNRLSYLGTFNVYKGDLPFGISHGDSADGIVMKLRDTGNGRIDDGYYEGIRARCVLYYFDGYRYWFEFNDRVGLKLTNLFVLKNDINNNSGKQRGENKSDSLSQQ